MLLAISVNTNEVNFYYFLSAGSSSYIQYSLPMALHLNVLIDMLFSQTSMIHYYYAICQNLYSLQPYASPPLFYY